MHRKISTAAVILAMVFWAPAARAQDVEVTVRVPSDVIREVNRLVEAVTGSEVERDIREALHDVAGSLRAVDGRELRDAIRDATRGLAYAHEAGWLDGQDRGFTAKQTDRQTKVFQLGPNGQLTLDNVVGDITVTAGSGRDVTVEIVREARGRTDADARTGLERVRVEATERAGRAAVRAVYQTENRSNYSVAVHYTVTAPAGTQVSAHSVTGNVSVTGLRGETSCVSISGNVRVERAGRVTEARSTAGNVSLSDVDSDSTVAATSTSGSVTAQRVKARRVDFGTVSDNIIARDIASESMEIHTITGDIELSGPLLPRSRCRLTSHSGDIRILTDGRTGFEFEGSSFSGDMHSDFPLQMTGPAAGRGPRRNLRGTYADGSASIVVTTFSGDVTIKKKA